MEYIIGIKNENVYSKTFIPSFIYQMFLRILRICKVLGTRER